MEPRIIDIDEYMPLVQELLAQGKSVSLTVTGESMSPFLRHLPDGNYALIGDGQQQVEKPIAPQQIFAVVTQVCRKGAWIGPEAFWWRFFAGPWLTLLPLRPTLRHLARWIPASLK